MAADSVYLNKKYTILNIDILFYANWDFKISYMRN